MKNHNYFVYIVTNKNTTVLYIGVTNDLKRRLYEHEEDAKNLKKHFTGKYNCYNLVYYERFQFIQHAIAREKELKGWTRLKKEKLIQEFNPDWKFLNESID
jgi:putative endonuclease